MGINGIGGAELECDARVASGVAVISVVPCFVTSGAKVGAFGINGKELNHDDDDDDDDERGNNECRLETMSLLSGCWALSNTPSCLAL